MRNDKSGQTPSRPSESLEPLAVEVGKVKEMAARTQKTLRLAKKAIERVGDRFWMDADPLPKMV